MSRRRPFLSLCGQPDSRPPPSAAAGEGGGSAADSAAGEERWASILPELLVEIVRRVDSSQQRWPLRRSLVSCASVCRRWREVTTSVVPPPSVSGKITFASSLKLPGPRDRAIQCFIHRNKRNSTFYLYLRVIRGLTPFMSKDKFLLAARRYRHGDHVEYIISFDADDFSQGSSAYVGKLRSDFWGTKFTIYDSLPPYDGAKTSSCSVSRRFPSKQISPQVSAGNFEIGQISYKSNLLRSRGPRRIQCILHRPSTQETTKGESLNKLKTYNPETGSGSMILNNRAPQWDEDLKCWCLNFHGDVTVASVKNFQLAAVADPSQSGGTGVNDAVLLQFGKIGDDAFSMDYRQPLSAFQAFAICLTSFGTKFACE